MTRALTAPRRRIALLVAGGALLLAVSLGLCAGPAGLGTAWLFDPPARALTLGLRLPRVLLALVVGAGLATSGAALQALLRNPLADPYIIGVSGGAAVGGALALATGLGALALKVPVGAFAGAFVASAGLAWFVARDRSNRGDAALLAGVVFNSFAAAVITLIKTLLPAERSYALLFWLVGSLGYVGWATLLGVAACVLFGCAGLIALGGRLELLSLGDAEAARLGVPVSSTKLLVYALASLVVGVLVPITGMIGFVGLVVPHALRLLLGPDQRLLLPASALGGACALVLFDAAARLGFSILDTELPVGALTAVVGAPVFAFALARRVMRGGIG